MFLRAALGKVFKKVLQHETSDDLVLARLCRLVEDVLMGQIFFKGEAPFELVTERDPIAIADEGL